MVLADALNNSKFNETIPDLTTTLYLGPDPESWLQSAALANDTMDEESGMSKTLLIVLSIGCSLLLLKAIFCIAFPKAPKAAVEKIKSHVSRRQHRSVSARVDQVENVLDDLSDGAHFVSNHDQNTNREI